MKIGEHENWIAYQVPPLPMWLLYANTSIDFLLGFSYYIVTPASRDLDLLQINCGIVYEQLVWTKLYYVASLLCESRDHCPTVINEVILPP